MDYEQCIVQVALYLDTHAQRCADFDGLENQNAPNRATCALDPPAAIQLRPRTRSCARTEQLLQRRVIAGKKRVCRATLFLSEFASEFASAHHMKPSLAIKQAVGYQRVQVRMKVEIFAESVDRHDDGWNAIVRRVANAACIAERITQKVTHALMRDAAELLEQSAVKSPNA